jgi:hypothetical protein
MDINYNEAGSISELVSGIKELISQEVDKLKNQILKIPVEKRSYFDIIKNWWSNLVHGHDNQNNPYIHRNRLGALGLKEYTLNKKEELDFILEAVELLIQEEASKTRFEGMLDNWAEKLKSKLGSFLKTCFSGNCEVPKPKPEQPEQQPEPEQPEQQSKEKLDTSANTTTTIRPQQPESSSKRNFSIFSDTLNDEEKAQIKQDFAPFLNLSNEEKENIIRVGNFGTEKIRPETNFSIPSIGINLPYFINSVIAVVPNPLWIIINKNYPEDSIKLKDKERMQDNITTPKKSLLSALKSRIKTEGTKTKYKEFIDTSLEILKAPNIKVNPKLWDSLIENQEKIKKFDDSFLEQMKEFLIEKEWDHILVVIESNKDHEFENEDEYEDKKESFEIKSLKTYMNESKKISLNKDETFYERILTCLEKMRSN